LPIPRQVFTFADRYPQETPMGQCNAQVFPNITPAQFEILMEKAHAGGIEISGNSGTASKFGIDVGWNYDPESQQLTIQATHVPFFVSCNDINLKIQKLVESSLG
jgi:hypothetical protein